MALGLRIQKEQNVYWQVRNILQWQQLLEKWQQHKINIAIKLARIMLGKHFGS
jgi:hypothetical protein